MRAFAFYTSLRLLLFLVVLFVVHLLGADGLLLVVISLIVSAALSYLLLKGPRDRVALQLQERYEAKGSRLGRSIEDDNAAEDHAADERR